MSSQPVPNLIQIQPAYVNASGRPVNTVSYSSRSEFRKCPRFFQLHRVQGWDIKRRFASMLFGKAIESGVQVFELGGREPGSAVVEFVRQWELAKTVDGFSEMEFTALEGSWEQLDQMGREMMKLYESISPTLPVAGATPLFQQKMRKQIFPGSHLATLENVAYLDILCFPEWQHPLLPKIERSDANQDGTRPLIIDIKTSGSELDTQFVPLDPQLAEYAWMTGIRDVGFLWFQKKGVGFKKGSRVTLIEPLGLHPASTELSVLEPTEDRILLAAQPVLEEYERVLEGTKGKAREAAKAAFLNSPRQILEATASKFTKQRIQFATTRFSVEDVAEVGQDVAQTTVAMVTANDLQQYPKLSGIRFPNEKCQYCDMRWICLNDSDGRDKNLTRRGEEWMDED